MPTESVEVGHVPVRLRLAQTAGSLRIMRKVQGAFVKRSQAPILPPIDLA
jgi:hypothetical protein